MQQIYINKLLQWTNGQKAQFGGPSIPCKLENPWEGEYHPFEQAAGNPQANINRTGGFFFKPSIDNCLYFFMGQLSNDYNSMTKSLPHWNKRLRYICMNWRIRDWEQLVLSLKVIETTTKIHSMHVGQEIEKITRVRDWEDNSKNKLY